MELRRYATVLRRWWWLVMVGILLAAASAYGVSLSMTPIYESSTTLLVNQANKSGVVDYSALQTGERLARTYAERLRARPVLEQVISQLGLVGTDVEDLDEQIAIQPVRDTQLLEIVVENPDPAVAAAVANTLPQVFIARNEALQLQRYASSKESLQRQMAILEKDMETIQATIASVDGLGDPDQLELNRLQTALSQYQISYSALLSRYEEIRLAEAQEMDSLVVDEPAVASQEPIRPRTAVNTLLAAAVGAMLAVGVVFLIEYLDDTVKTPEDIEELAALPTLGAIVALDQNHRALPIAVAEPRSPAVEAFRGLRTNIQYSVVDRPLCSLAVTSAGPMEGKSTVSANLAVVMAQSGLSTILVDADMRRPTVHDQFGLPNAGLTTCLLQPPAVEDLRYLQDSSVANLRLLTSGEPPPNPAELLGSERMRGLMTRLAAEADVVIYDTPPALTVTDAVVLSKQVDGVLLVVDCGATSRAALVRLAEEMRRVGANVLGVVLNRLTKRNSGYTYQHYYSDNGYYSTDGKGKGPRSLASRLPLIGQLFAKWSGEARIREG